MKRCRVTFILIAVAAFELWAQGERGAFNGVITDASGSVVPRATVTATEVTTNVETTATTTDAGVYRLPYIPAGTYRISASKSGFQTAVRENVILQCRNFPVYG